MTDHEQRIRKLEERYIQLEAASIMATQAMGVLLALVEDTALDPQHRHVQREDMRRTYNRLLREHTDKFLALVSDHDPNLAAKLRGVMRQQLDGPDPDPSA